LLFAYFTVIETLTHEKITNDIIDLYNKYAVYIYIYTYTYNQSINQNETLLNNQDQRYISIEKNKRHDYHVINLNHYPRHF